MSSELAHVLSYLCFHSKSEQVRIPIAEFFVIECFIMTNHFQLSLLLCLVLICDWLWEKGHIRANNDFSVQALLFEET